jgi:hypothetical protein
MVWRLITALDSMLPEETLLSRALVA